MDQMGFVRKGPVAMTSTFSSTAIGEGRVALVLGAIKGIGKGIGLDLARRGFCVALTHYDWEDALPGMQADFAVFGEKCLIVRVNLRDCNRVAQLISEVVARFGRLDILINNIERGGWPVVHGPYSPDQWDLEMETTLRAKRWVFEAALPHLRAGGNGCVVNLSSIAGLIGRSGPASLIFNDGYAAANRAVALLTESWARAAAPEVRVNEIMLGLVATRHGEETRGWGLLKPEQKQALLDHTLLRRTGTIEDVVKAVRFVIEEASFMSGSVIRLDGGYVLGGEVVLPMPNGVL
jgi:3-oxoacyl-[acyl-carrier protein] reductase